MTTLTESGHMELKREDVKLGTELAVKLPSKVAALK